MAGCNSSEALFAINCAISFAEYSFPNRVGKNSQLQRKADSELCICHFIRQFAPYTNGTLVIKRVWMKIWKRWDPVEFIEFCRAHVEAARVTRVHECRSRARQVDAKVGAKRKRGPHRLINFFPSFFDSSPYLYAVCFFHASCVTQCRRSWLLLLFPFAFGKTATLNQIEKLLICRDLLMHCEDEHL